MEIDGYRLNNAEEIDTPAFLVYEDLVRHNIDEIIRICGTADRIVAHAKTHKSSEVLRLQMAGGLKSFKCATLKEAEMLAENGVDEIIVAYPLVHPKKLKRFASLMRQYREIDIKAIVSTPEHLEGLSQAMLANSLNLDVYVDLDTGMRRTGVQPGEEAGAFYVQASETPALNVLGVHIFDGQTLYKPDHAERKALVDRSIEHMHEVWDYAAKHGLDAVDNVVGGSWSFQHYLGEENVRVSPGTWVYWDSRNATMTELGFKIAAVVLGQVIDRDPEMDTVTTDIGSKACAPDQPLPTRLKLIGYPEVELVGQSEEHGVVKLNGEHLDVGDLVLAAPGHACTTTVKFPFALVVNEAGDVVGRYNHDARDH